MDADENLAALGREIRRRRKANGLSQEALAELCGLHPNYIGLIERGERNASVRTVVMIARALGVGPAALFGGEA